MYSFGIIGCGRIAKNHLEAVANSQDARLGALCDIDAQRLAACTERYECRGYREYRELLQDPRVDIISICTPSGLHARMAVDALNAGKHVLVEKPMAMSLLEADAMIAAARKNRVRLGVVHQNRFNPAIVKLRRAVEAGKFGQFTHAAAAIRWNRGEEYYRQAPWRGTWAQDGGCLMNQSIHNIDLLQWMMGPVKTVFAYADTRFRPIEAEDVAVALLRFASGAFGMIEAATTIFPANLEETLSLFGSSGTAVVGGIAVNQIETWRFDGEEEASALREGFAEPPNVYGFGHAEIIRDFIAALAQDKEPAVTGAEGRKALEIILAIYHSVRLHREITLPLDEKFRIGVGM